MTKLEIVTAERRQHDAVRVERDFAQVENSTLIEMLYDRGVLGVKDAPRKLAEQRRDHGLWLMELYSFIYRSEGVAKYQPPGTGGGDYEMSDEEAELRSLYHRYLRTLPPVVSQTLRFICKDQSLPKLQGVPLVGCLDKLGGFRTAERDMSDAK